MTFWPYFLSVSAAAMYYICINFGVDSSSHFPFTVRTQRHIDTDATDHPIPNLGYHQCGMKYQKEPVSFVQCALDMSGAWCNRCLQFTERDAERRSMDQLGRCLADRVCHWWWATRISRFRPAWRCDRHGGRRTSRQDLAHRSRLKAAPVAQHTPLNCTPCLW